MAGKAKQSKSKSALTGSGKRKRVSGPSTVWGTIKRFVRWAVALVFILVMIPTLLTILYRFDFVRPVSTLMIADTVTGRDMKREWVDIEDVAPTLYQSVLMSEDGQFCSHKGIDLAELNAIIEDALDGEATRGASTITMQVSKNLFLWGGRSYLRKAIELPLAVWVDFVIPKKRIMEIYLNIAEWAPGTYGVEAGAKHHFGVSAAQLTPRQSALMTIALPNPYTRNPAKPTAKLRQVADVIQRRAAKSGGYVGCLK